MTDPRCIERGETYLVTRRCAQRQFLLTPTALVTQIFLYALAYVAQKYGVALHGFVMMSNHYHLVLTDVLGVLPNLVRDLNSMLTRAINLVHRRRETIWSSEKPSYVALVGLEDIIAKCAYTLTNPVAAGLVDSHSQWPGAISRLDAIDGAVLTIKKPPIFFGKSFPDTIELRIVPPPAEKLEGTGPEEFRAEVRARVEEAESDLRLEREGAGKRVVGAANILRQSPFEFPSSAEDRSDGRSGFSPRIAAQDKWRRIEAIERLREFIRAYRAALAEYRAGNRDVVFPKGTWKMRVELGVRCEPDAESS